MYLIGEEGGMPREMMKTVISDALDDLPPDVLRLMYRIVFYSQSGLE